VAEDSSMIGSFQKTFQQGSGPTIVIRAEQVKRYSGIRQVPNGTLENKAAENSVCQKPQDGSGNVINARFQLAFNARVNRLGGLPLGKSAGKVTEPTITFKLKVTNGAGRFHYFAGQNAGEDKIIDCSNNDDNNNNGTQDQEIIG
jgi:hypothetical protein